MFSFLFFFFLIYNSKENTKKGETEIIHKIELKNWTLNLSFGKKNSVNAGLWRLSVCRRKSFSRVYSSETYIVDWIRKYLENFRNVTKRKRTPGTLLRWQTENIERTYSFKKMITFVAVKCWKISRAFFRAIFLSWQE